MIAVEPAVDPSPLRGPTMGRSRTDASLQRARGIARLTVAAAEGRTRLSENYQSGSAKLRFPRAPSGDRFAAVLVNTAGGITGGDRFSWSVTVGAHASATVAGQAAERIYRRTAGDAAIETITQRRRGRRARLAAAGDHSLRPLVPEAHAHR